MTIQEKITGFQLGLLLIPMVIATELLTVPAGAAAFAKQDTWLTPIPAAVTGFWSIMVISALAKRYPGKTVVEYGKEILGKWLGSLWEFLVVLC